MRRNASPRSTRRAAASSPRPPIAPLRISRTALRRIGIVAVWSAVFCGVAYGLHRLEPVSRAIHGDNACTLRWVELPAWLADSQSQDVLCEIEAAAGLSERDSIHDPQLCERVAAGLRACPWIAAVERVTKQADGVVRVRATFRRPLAMVVKDKLACVVDVDGVRLPRQSPASDAAKYNFLVISGVRTPMPAIGVAWNADDLTAGLQLAHFIENAAADGRAPVRAALRGVDVGNVARRRNPRDGELRLTTIHRDCYIEWGLPPGQEYDIESTAERKLGYLNGILSQYGRWPEDLWFDVRAQDRIEWGKIQRATP